MPGERDAQKIFRYPHFVIDVAVDKCIKNCLQKGEDSAYSESRIW